MKVFNIQLKKSEVIIDIVCDCCGKSCKVDEFIIDNEVRLDHGEPAYTFEYMDLKASWGWCSNKDLETWTAQICEKCVEEKLGFIGFQKDHFSKKNKK